MIVELTVSPLSMERRADVASLLVCEPPDTARQAFIGLTTEDASYEIVHEIVSGQRGYLFRGNLMRQKRLEFHFARGPGKDQSRIFAEFDNEYTRLDVSATALGHALSIDPAGASVHDLAAAIADKFEYGAKNATLCTPRLFPGIATGNCIDINTLFLASLRCLRRRASYLAGYYFNADQAGEIADGIHCWLAAEDGGGAPQEWDIAHCLRAGLASPEAIPDPLGGARFAFSYGRGLRFTGNGCKTAPISHGARPHWMMTDGSVIEATIEAKLLATTPVGEAALPAVPQHHNWEDRTCVMARNFR
jgi:hypothetical protein